MKQIKYLKLLVFVFVFLFYAFLNIEGTNAIYRDTFSTTFDLTIHNADNKCTANLNAMGGTVNPFKIVVDCGQQIGELPVPEKANSVFVGWYTGEYDGTMINETRILNSTTTFYAHYEPLVCKKATTLHEETCQRSDGKGCSYKVADVPLYASGAPITYGNIPDDDSPASGDAYDCDVNGNGVYDERFYVLRLEDNKAYMIYSAGFGIDNENNKVPTYTNIYSYDTGLTYLPDSEVWPNIPEISSGVTSRLVTLDDLTEACDEGTGNGKLNSCNYIFDHTSFSVNNSSYGRSATWIEKDGNQLIRFHVNTVSVANAETTATSLVKPVVEIPVTSIEGFVAVAPFRIQFDSQGGPTVEDRYRYNNQAIGELPEIDREGYRFDGWFTEAEGGVQVNKFATITRDVVYYAHYTEKVLVTFDPGEDATASFTEKYVAKGEQIGELPTADKEDHTFMGWFASADSQTSIGTTEVINAAVTFIAKWDSDDGSVARIGDQRFATLSLALSSINNSNQTTIYLLKDISGEHVTIGSNRNIILSGQNHIITWDPGTGNTTPFMENSGTLTIVDGITIRSNAKAAIINNKSSGILNIEGGRLTATGLRQAIYNDGGITNISGTAYLENSNTERAPVQNYKGTMYITGGTIVATGHHGVQIDDTSTLTVIGTDDAEISTTSPLIEAKKNGVNTSSKSFEMYDGIIKGETHAVSNNDKVTVKEGVNKVIGAEGNYETLHLEYDVPEGSHTVTFNANGGTSSLASKTVDNATAIGSLPTASNGNLYFMGWFTKAVGGEEILEDRLITSDIEVFAQYAGTICKRATTLHNDGTYTYGSIQSGETLKTGDAFDCDVNGDNVFDSTNERFYYLTSDSHNNGVLILSNSTSASGTDYAPMCNYTAVNYATGSNNIGPNVAYTELPDRDTWTNVKLYQNGLRHIVYHTGTDAVDFTYTNRAARLATTAEISSACNITVVNNPSADYLSANCKFLLENLGNSVCRDNYWLETPRAGGVEVYRIDKAGYVGYKNAVANVAGVRPVIEVPLELIEKEVKIVEHDIMNPAMREYFDNIDTWSQGQTNDNNSTYTAALTNTLDKYSCSKFNGDNRDSQNNTTYCDQPNKYDTGVRGDLDVYKYNRATGDKSVLATYVTDNDGYIYNMIPNEIYYWESTTDSSVNGYVKAVGERRIISIDNTETLNGSDSVYKTRNVRDLGGIKVDSDGDGTVDGYIKYGKLFRGEKIWGGDGNTRALLEKLGVYNEMDLRKHGDSEIVASEEDRLQNNVTNTGKDTFEIVHYGIDYGGYDVDNTHYDYYQLSRDALTRVMEEFVNDTTGNYALYFHCRIGADRTGTLAYLIEGILGANEEERYRDYELTVFFGLRERTRFYENKTTNHIKFNHMKAAMYDSVTDTENVYKWYMSGSTNQAADDALINAFKQKMIEPLN